MVMRGHADTDHRTHFENSLANAKPVDKGKKKEERERSRRWAKRGRRGTDGGKPPHPRGGSNILPIGQRPQPKQKTQDMRSALALSVFCLKGFRGEHERALFQKGPLVRFPAPHLALCFVSRSLKRGRGEGLSPESPSPASPPRSPRPPRFLTAGSRGSS